MATIKKLRDRIAELLQNNTELQQDDIKLLLTLWKEDMKDEKGMSYFSWGLFCEKLEAHKLSNPVSVVRVRRKLQEVNPELYGKPTVDRKHEVKRVKHEVKHFLTPKIYQQYHKPKQTTLL